MNNVVENIEYLVRRFDCVVVPSWGAFIAHYESARYSESEALFYPPRRNVAFNISVDHNDGLLASSVSRRLGIAYTQASKIVDDEVQVMKRQLELDGELSLGSIGRFIYQEGSSPIFEPSESLLRFETYCMQPIAAQLLTKRIAEETKTKETQSELLHPKRKRRFKLARIAAAMVVAIGVSAVLMVPSMLNRNDNQASMSPGASIVALNETICNHNKPIEAPILTDDIAQAETSAENPLNNIAPADVVTSVEVSHATELVQETPARRTVEPTVVTAHEPQPAPDVAPAQVEPKKVKDNYCLVVASLTSMELANKYIREEGIPGMDVYAADGKYRVYVAKAPTSGELESIKSANYTSKYPDAWVCRMK